MVSMMEYEATLANGQVRIHLPFAVDPQRLSRQLLREGFPLAHELHTTDTQGWGHDFQSNGYYPYWVYPDPEHPGRSVFAFNPQPEDVVDDGGADEHVELGERSARVVRRWVPVLERLQQAEGPS
jgi:hypothetical protein